jgi:predicted ATPase
MIIHRRVKYSKKKEKIKKKKKSDSKENGEKRKKIKISESGNEPEVKIKNEIKIQPEVKKEPSSVKEHHGNSVKMENSPSQLFDSSDSELEGKLETSSLDSLDTPMTHTGAMTHTVPMTHQKGNNDRIDPFPMTNLHGDQIMTHFYHMTI